jgi:hypothetical protein
VQRFVQLIEAHRAAGDWSPEVSVLAPGETIELHP